MSEENLYGLPPKKIMELRKSQKINNELANPLIRSAGSRYQNIQSETTYRTLMNSGMFFEFHPELSGDWEQDKKVIFENIQHERRD